MNTSTSERVAHELRPSGPPGDTPAPTRSTLLLLLALPLLVALPLLASACGDDEEDDCVDSSCTSPPAAFCDGDLAITYAATGSCQLDACRYATTTVDCAAQDQTCLEGTCQP